MEQNRSEFSNVDERLETLITFPDADEHCHDIKVDLPFDKRARNRLIIASILCLLFMIGDVVGGAISGSLAIMTDAAHLLTDFASFMISLFALYLGAKKASHRMSFGWYRAEVIGALVSILLIWVVTGILVYMAVQRVINSEFDLNAKAMLITAGIGVAINIIMGLTLHQHGHSHGGGSKHTHTHDQNKKKDKRKKDNSDDAEALIDTGAQTSTSDKHTTGDTENNDDAQLLSTQQPSHEGQNLNVRAAFIHVVGDFFQSIGVLIAATIIYFKPDYKLADPICTFLFSVLVLFTTLTIMRDTINVLMEGSPKGINYEDLQRDILAIPGIKQLHNMRLWSITLERTALSVHLVCESGFNTQTILNEAIRISKLKYGIIDVTIQVEEYLETMDDCHKCEEK